MQEMSIQDLDSWAVVYHCYDYFDNRCIFCVVKKGEKREKRRNALLNRHVFIQDQDRYWLLSGHQRFARGTLLRIMAGFSSDVWQVFSHTAAGRSPNSAS